MENGNSKWRRNGKLKYSVMLDSVEGGGGANSQIIQDTIFLMLPSNQELPILK